MSKRLSALTEITEIDADALFYIVDLTRTAGDQSVGANQETLAASVGSSSIVTNPVENEYADITELLADQADQTESFFQYVLDASADPAVGSGDAYYEKLAGSTAALVDYRLLSDSETEVIRDSNSYRVFRIEFVQDDTTPLTSIRGGRIGFEYDTGGGLVTAVVFNKRYTDAILKFYNTDVNLKFYNRTTRLYQKATIASGDWSTVGTHYYKALVGGTITASDLTVNDRIENFMDLGGSGGGTDESVKVSANDTTAGYLNGKLVAGTNITLVEGNDGGDETLTINSTGGGIIVYNVKDYGALGDGVDYEDGAITATDATFTSASNPFVVGDVGKVISIEGAGTAGAYHVTTIASYTSAGEVELTDVGVTTVSGAIYCFGTDDTVDIQTTIQAAYDAGGGVVYIPNGVYILNGALQNNVGASLVDYNSQLYIPEENFDNPARTSIEIRGEVIPCFNQTAGIGLATTPNNGVVLRSTIQGSGTRPSVICNRGASTNFENISYTSLLIEKLSIQVTVDANSKITMGGVNSEFGAIANFKYVTVFPYNLNLVNSGEPDVIDVVGISVAQVNGEWINTVANCTLGGFTHGYLSGEHSSFIDCVATACVNGFTQGFNNEFASFRKVEALWCKYAFNVDAVSFFDVVSLSTEWYEDTKWYDTVATINDPSNYGVGIINWSIVEGFVGVNNSLYVKIGGDNIRTSPISVDDLINTQSGTSYTFGILDAYRLTEGTNASDTVFTIPPASTYNYDLGATIKSLQSGDGQLSYDGGAGVTINTPTSLSLRTKYSEAKATKTATNTWNMAGDLESNPSLLSATIDTGTLTDIVMVFSQVVTGTNLGFTIGGTTSTTFSSISGSGTNTITGVLAVATADTETVTLSYDSGTGDIENSTGDPLKSITSYAVVFNFNYLFDTYTGEVGYSFQKLKSSETYGLRVRRSSDNAETDVELESTGSITLSSLVSAGGDFTTWLGASDGYITKLYDQSGNSNDFVQATTSLQAKIATAGVLELKDSKAAATFASDSYLATALTCMQGGNEASVFALAASNSLATNGVLWSTNDNSGGGAGRINMSFDTSTAKIFTYNLHSGGTLQLDLVSQINTTDRRLQTWIKDATDQYAFLDGTAVDNGFYNGGTINNVVFQLGAQLNGVSYFSGEFQELIVFATDQTSNRATIEAHINGRY